MLRICIWMNVPSHHQSAFFLALDHRSDVDLHVVYFDTASQRRVAEGWKDEHVYQPFESSVKGESSPAQMIRLVPEWKGRIQIISGNFSSELVDWFCASSIPWCHWSEMPGIRLADLLDYRMWLFRMLNPLMLFSKRREGKRIKNYALGAFSQGRLAHRAFRLMGVPERMISDLFYVPAGLDKATPHVKMLEFSKSRKIVLVVGTLCRRKGIDVLLKAFAKLDKEEWCLVLCGLDCADGIYQALARKLGIADQVLFLGVYPSERISEVYSAADLFVIASRFDGWGAVLNEAASLGLPMIGTDLCGASWHVIEPGITGSRVKAGSIRDLKNTMQDYMTCPLKGIEHGNAAKQRFSEFFSPEKNAERLVQGLKKWEMS